MAGRRTLLGKTLLDKVWDAHSVRELPSGQTQLFIGLHLIHEVTSPQAFAALREAKLRVPFPQRTFATVDHIIPTDSQARPLGDALAEEMFQHLERNCAEHGIAFFGPESGHQGIVHVIGPELGLTQPGMTIACGDSHTSTHGAFGAVAFGIGTSQVRDVLATQCLAMARPKVRRIEVNGKLGAGVYAKDVTLHIIRKLGVKGGIGFAYEYAGDVLDAMTLEERMTVCNMSIEGGARCGYVNPDETTFAYLRGREYAPKGEAWDRARRVVARHGERRQRELRRSRRVRSRGDRADHHLGHQSGPGARRRRTHPASRERRRRRTRQSRRGDRLHGLEAGRSGRRHEDRRRLHRLLHERPHLGSARSGARCAHRQSGARRTHLRGARLAGGAAPGGGRGTAREYSARRASTGASPAARCASR